MSTVRMVAIPEADADLLLKGLRNQASGSYSAPWVELCDRMVKLLEGTVVWQGEPLTHAEDMAQATAQLDKMTPKAAHITLAGEIRPGGWYVLQTERKLRPQEAMRCKEQLTALFPGATFAIIDGDLKFVTELADLRSAVERARGKAKDYWLTAKTESERLSYHAVACAMEMLARELTPERDGAGALPVQPPEPVAATPTPVPSRPPICGAPYVFSGHPGIVCRKDQGHPDEEAHHDWTHDWEVWWK